MSDYTTCPDCGANMAVSIQVRKGRFKPYPSGYVTCCNVACRLVVDTNTGTIYDKGKKRRKNDG